jgi:hypothetical protein
MVNMSDQDQELAESAIPGHCELVMWTAPVNWNSQLRRHEGYKTARHIIRCQVKLEHHRSPEIGEIYNEVPEHFHN